MQQKQLRQWSDDYEPRTTGIDISRMAYAALGIDPPLKAATPAEAIEQRTFRTTEYAIRRTAPNTPDRPEDDTAFDPILDGRVLEDESETVQASLPVATDGGVPDDGSDTGGNTDR